MDSVNLASFTFTQLHTLTTSQTVTLNVKAEAFGTNDNGSHRSYFFPVEIVVEEVAVYSPVDVTPSYNWLPYSLQDKGSGFKFEVSLDRGGSSIPTTV